MEFTTAEDESEWMKHNYIRSMHIIGTMEVIRESFSLVDLGWSIYVIWEIMQCFL